LQDAKEYLKQRPAVAYVNMLYQEPGEEKPDGHVIKEHGDVAHPEAEVTTLTKPAKVLQNLWRAAFNDRKCIFVVEEDTVDKSLNIVEDPVNRRGSDHEDEKGSFSYYTDEDGEPFTGIQDVANADYRVLVRSSTGRVRDHGTTPTEECPELDDTTDRDELQSLCFYRDEEGFCEKLGQPCVLTDTA